MAKYFVIYHAPISFADAMQNATPEEMQKGMEPWTAWAQRCGDGLVEMGSPLANATKVTKTGSAPGDKSAVGYSILQAEDIDGALALLEGHPHLDWTEGCEIEVFESQTMEG